MIMLKEIFIHAPSQKVIAAFYGTLFGEIKRSELPAAIPQIATDWLMAQEEIPEEFSGRSVMLGVEDDRWMTFEVATDDGFIYLPPMLLTEAQLRAVRRCSFNKAFTVLRVMHVGMVGLGEIAILIAADKHNLLTGYMEGTENLHAFVLSYPDKKQTALELGRIRIASRIILNRHLGQATDVQIGSTVFLNEMGYASEAESAKDPFDI
jgi:hypothetical protein